MDSSEISSIISNTINNMFNKIFSSIDNNLYSVLDDFTFINSDILNDGIITRFDYDSLSDLVMNINSIK